MLRLENANAFGPHSAIPFIVADAPVHGEAIYVSLVMLTAEPLDPDEARGTVVAAEASPDRVRLVFRDGEELLVPIGPPPRRYAHEERTAIEIERS